MTECCKRYDKCYFPKDISKGMHGKNGMERYLNSCHYKGMDCDLEKLSDIEFKIFERFDSHVV